MRGADLGAALDIVGWGVCVGNLVAALPIAAGLTRRFVIVP